ncbi:hypothetical protein JCM3765_000476 [Sporobolomyces pararoseus]
MSLPASRNRREYRECKFFLNSRPILRTDNFVRKDSLECELFDCLATTAGLVCVNRRSDGIYLSFLSGSYAISAFEKMRKLRGITVQYLTEECPGKWPAEERFDHPRPPNDRLFFIKGIDLTNSQEFNPDPIMHSLWEHNIAWWDYVAFCDDPEVGFEVLHSILVFLEKLSAEEVEAREEGGASTPITQQLDKIVTGKGGFDNSVEEREKEENVEVKDSDGGVFESPELEMSRCDTETAKVERRRSMDPMSTPDSPRYKRFIEGEELPDSPSSKRRKSILSLEPLSPNVSRDQDSPTQLVSNLSLHSRSEEALQRGSGNRRNLGRSQSCLDFTSLASQNRRRPSFRRPRESQIVQDPSPIPPVLEDETVNLAQLLPPCVPVVSSSNFLPTESPASLTHNEGESVASPQTEGGFVAPSENTRHAHENTILSLENNSNLQTVTPSSPAPSLRPRHSPTPSTSQRSSNSLSLKPDFVLGGGGPSSPAISTVVAIREEPESYLKRHDYLARQNSEKFKGFIQRVKQNSRKGVQYRKCLRYDSSSSSIPRTTDVASIDLAPASRSFFNLDLKSGLTTERLSI